MIASALISYDIPPLKMSDTGTKALDWMEEFKVTCIPVIDGKKYVGIIEEIDVLDRNNLSDQISTYNLKFRTPSAHQSQHLFEIIALTVQNDMDVLPVVDESNNYLGLITTKKILHYLAQAISIVNAGSIITLELNANDYSLSEVSKMVESDDAKILASYITSAPDKKKIELTIKVNKTEITRILHTFDRFNYTVTAVYNETEYHQDLKERYDEFLRFLNP